MKKVVVRLDTSGLLTASTGLALLTVGALSDNPIISLWGQVFLATVALAWPLALRQALRADSETLEVQCDVPSGPGGGLTAGGEFSLPLRLINHGRRRVTRIGLQPVTSSGIDVTSPPEGRAIEGSSSLSWDLPARAVRAGPAHVHGVHLRIGGPSGFFTASVYRPIGRAVKVLPRTAATRRGASRLLTVAAWRDALSPAAHPERGLGSDVRELRDHHPGDPFKHIAWKATARARRLIVREFESEVTLSVYTLLDMGASMRWGEAGETPLDAGIDLAFHLARALDTGRDRFGLITFDQEVFGFTRATAGYGTRQQVAAHLMELHAVVREGFTEDLSNTDLVARVAEFMRIQEGVDLSLPELSRADLPDLGPWDDAAVVARARDFLEERSVELRRLSHYFGRPAAEPDASVLRTWCRLRGVELPYRIDALPAPRAVGIEAAVQKAVADHGGPHTLVVISDLAGVRRPEHLIPVVRLARAHRHRLLFIIPGLHRTSPPLVTGDPLERRLQSLFTEDARRRQSAIATQLRAQGVPVHVGADASSLLRGAGRSSAPRPARAMRG